VSTMSAMTNEIYIYDSAFQNMAATGSTNAASRIISFVQAIVPVRRVMDVGCARGTWLREWQRQGANEIVGVDGDYVDRSKLEIDPACFVVRDLAERFNLERQFDLAQSLEVAEHLPPARAATFVNDLVAHAPVVLFSAAPPGQGGEHHVNEQPGEYWRKLFRNHDHVAIDCLRPLLAREPNIPTWYRYNIMLYVRCDHLERIAPLARQFQLRENEPMSDPSPLAYKLRKRIVRSLPRSICNQLARWNARRFPAD
jgi:SAM-dependent methyltransferase